MPLWHKHYFNLKTVEKQQMPERHFNFPFHPENRRYKSPCERQSPCPRRKETFFKMESQSQENSI